MYETVERQKALENWREFFKIKNTEEMKIKFSGKAR